MKILFYTPLNTRSRDIESQAIEFNRAGHEIFLLTQTQLGEIHNNFKSYGFNVFSKTFSSQRGAFLILKRWLHLITFCWRNKIDVMYAHLEPANFIAVLAQYFIKTRVIICRHHADVAKYYSFGTSFSYKVTYKLAKEIIVVSNRAKEYMIAEENVPGDRIHKINLSYNYSLYPFPDEGTVKNIRQQFSADVLLLTVCRLTVYKRPESSIEVVKKLVSEGIDAKLLILGDGDLREPLEKKIKNLELEDRVFMPGYVKNVQDYMGSVDFLIHPSISESSCITLKEAGFVKLPAIVCEQIGDFSEVVVHEQNGFIINPDHFVSETVNIIKAFRSNKSALQKIGENLQTTIFNLFDIKKTAPYYESHFHQKK